MECPTSPARADKVWEYMVVSVLPRRTGLAVTVDRAIEVDQMRLLMSLPWSSPVVLRVSSALM